MIIGLDWDNTYTRRPDFWFDFVGLCTLFQVKVIIVTNRGPEFPCERPPVTVVYANGQPKRQAAKAAGYHVDIWIDDFPHLVDFGAGHPAATALGLP